MHPGYICESPSKSTDQEGVSFKLLRFCYKLCLKLKSYFEDDIIVTQVRKLWYLIFRFQVVKLLIKLK